MALVSKWLSDIGLEYAVPSFRAAGIVTVDSLASLEVGFFEALGIASDEDRRKLFFLVQRVKMKLGEQQHQHQEDDGKGEEEDEEEGDEEEEEEEPVSVTSSSDGGAENQNVPTTTAPATRKVVVNTRGSTARKTPDPHQKSAYTAPVSTSSTTSSAAAVTGSIVPPRQKRLSGVPQPSKKTTSSTTASGSNTNGINNRRNSDAAAQVGVGVGVGAGLGVPRSMRTGKQLSSIPANGQLPMSPLVELPSAVATRTAASATTATKDDSHVAVRSSRRSNATSSGIGISSRRSLGGTTTRSRLTTRLRSAGSSDDDDLSIASSPCVTPSSPSGSKQSSKNGSLEQQLGKLPSRRGGSRGRSTTTGYSSRLSLNGGTSSRSSSRRSLQQGQPAERKQHNQQQQPAAASSLSPKRRIHQQQQRPALHAHAPHRPPSSPTRTGSGNTSMLIRRGGVGCDVQPDDSFRAQIDRLREDNDDEHELFHDNNDYSDTDAGDTDNSSGGMRIRVVVRKRPLSRQEAVGDVDVIHPLDCGTFGRVLVYQPRTRVDLTKEIDTQKFGFDNVFDETANNRDLYERSVRPIIPNLLEGEWASIFAYGQTGSGKTFTMMGANVTTGGGSDGSGDESNDNSISSSNWGLYYLAALDIFHQIHTNFPDLYVRVSLFEIYGGKLFDLLNARTPVKCLENARGRVCFIGLSEHDAKSPQDLLDCIERGTQQRSTGTTSRNADSSRSHAVLQLHLYRRRRSNGTTTTNNRRVGSTNSRRGNSTTSQEDEEYSRLTFIDLAGSERGADTSSASRATRMEGAEINTSLLALKEVIRAMATGDSMTHVPFRGSRLTQVLKESFVGSKTCQSVMIACISPNIGNCEQTLNTLRYADRVKERNAETGKLSVILPLPQQQSRRAANNNAVNSQPPQPRNIGNPRWEREPLHTPVKVATEEEEEEVDDEGDDGDLCRVDDSPILDVSTVSNASALLDDILATPRANASDSVRTPMANGDSGGSSKSITVHNNVDNNNAKRQAAQQLIAVHKEAAAAMLQMLNEEMTLVNQMEEDRDGLDDYMAQITDIQERQLSIIVTLREHLLQYHEADDADCDDQAAAGLLAEDDDDDFEDLRD